MEIDVQAFFSGPAGIPEKQTNLQQERRVLFICVYYRSLPTFEVTMLTSYTLTAVHTLFTCTLHMHLQTPAFYVNS